MSVPPVPPWTEIDRQNGEIKGRLFQLEQIVERQNR